MFGSEILEVAIGLIFFYILLSLICSAINEWISRIFALRAKNLEKAISKLLNDSKDKKLTKEFYKHPLIEVLAEKSWLDKLFKREARPSYIPKEYFPKAFLSAFDIDDTQTFAESITKIQNENIKNRMLKIVSGVADSFEERKEYLENWFNATMERAAGWYKRKVQAILLILALLVTVLLNADTIMISKYLLQNDAMRAAIVNIAEKVSEKPISDDTESSLAKLKEFQTELHGITLPFGWSNKENDIRNWPDTEGDILVKILGLLLTAFAVSLGAPFWFDILSKFVKVRQTGEKIETKKENNKKKQEDKE